MAYLITGIVYAIGFVITGCVFAAIGEANPRTYGDTWTGDNTLDLISLIVWPFSIIVGLSCYAGNRIGRGVVQTFPRL